MNSDTYNASKTVYRVGTGVAAPAETTPVAPAETAVPETQAPETAAPETAGPQPGENYGPGMSAQAGENAA